MVITMGKIEDRAEDLFKEGYNCAQSVLGAFCEAYGLDMDTALRLSCSFGGGFGRMRHVCGAVSGMCMVAGLFNGNTDPNNQQAKTDNYQLVRDLAAQFEKSNGSIICRELLGLDGKGDEEAAPEARTKEYYQRRPCVELVREAARIAEQYCLK